MKTTSLRSFFHGIKFSLSALLACVLFGGTLTANGPAVGPVPGIAWQADLEQAAMAAEQTNRLLFIHFYGDNCPPCKLMDSAVFTDPAVIGSLNRDFVAVKVHTAQQKVLAEQYGIKAIPTDIVLKPNGQLLHRRQGGITKERFVEYTTFLVDKARQESPKPAVVAAPSLPPAPVLPQIAATAAPPATTIRDPFTRQVVTPPVEPTLPAAPPVVHAPPTAPPVMPQPAVQPLLPPVTAQAPTVVPGPAAAPPVNPTPTLTPPPMGQPAPTVNPIVPPAAVAQAPTFREPPPGPPCNVDEVPKTMVEVPLGLEGYCPVLLSREERWVPGNPAYYTMFRGHVFRFSSEEAMTEFAKAPLNFSPVAMGEDIVQMVNRNKKVYGNRKFGVWFQGRVFLFCNQESLDAFAERPEYFAEIATKYETAFKGVHGLF